MTGIDGPPLVSEEAAFAKWGELASLIDVLAQRSDVQGEWDAQPRSSLAADDRHTEPYQSSHAVHYCIVAAIDHAHAVKTLVYEHQTIHVAAPASLARGLIENAACAYWLLRPASRVERVTRTLKWNMKNAHDQDQALSRFPSPQAVTLTQKRERLMEVAQRAGADPARVERGYRPTDPVKYANDEPALAGLDVMFVWQLCSGFAHGRPWASLGILERELFETPDPEVRHIRLNNDFARSLFPTLIGLHVLQEALRTHMRRAQP